MGFNRLRTRLPTRTQIVESLQERQPNREQAKEIGILTFDLLLLLSIALLIIMVDRTPASFQESLALHHDDPRVLQLWSTHFVHSQEIPAHLSSNVKGFLLIGAFAYVVSMEVEARPSFKTVFAALFLIIAPLISVINLALLEPTAQLIDPTVSGITNRGLSAINAGLIGYLLIATTVLGHEKLPVNMTVKTGVQLAVWGGLVIVLWEMYDVFGTQLWFIGLPIILLIGISIFAFGVALHSVIPGVDAETRLKQVRTLMARAWAWLQLDPLDHGGISFMVAAGFFTVIVLIGDLITLPPLIDGRNTIGHASGLFLGAALAWKIFSDRVS